MDYMKDIQEITDEQAVILWQTSRLSLSEKYEKAPEILSVKGSVIGTLGNFSASIGKAKSKKTFNVSAIVAAALKNGTVLRYAAELPEAKRKVLYVDTEQSPYHYSGMRPNCPKPNGKCFTWIRSKAPTTA